jgi:hypothetical protein
VTFAEILQVDGLNNLATENYAAFGQPDFRRPTDRHRRGRYTKERKTEASSPDANGLTYRS